MSADSSWAVIPKVGLGPLRLGMSRDDAAAVLGDLGTVHVRAIRSDEPGVDNGEGLFAYCRDGRVEAIEIANLGDRTAARRITLFDWDVFGTPANTLIRDLNGLDCPIVLTGRSTSVAAPTLGIGLWRGGDDLGAVDDIELPRFFNSVLVAGPSYFADLVHEICDGIDA